MNQSRPDIVLVMLGLSKVYREELTDPLVEIWIAALDDLSPEEIKFAAKQYLQGDNPFFPKPGQLYKIARPPIDYETESTLVAEEVISLLGVCGADSGERAMSKLSERGQAYIQQVGGWYKFASNMQREQDDNLGTIKSQIRKAVMGIQQRRTSTTLALEKKDVGLTRLGDIFKNKELD